VRAVVVGLWLAVSSISCASSASLGGAPTAQTMRVDGPGGGALKLSPSADENVFTLSFTVAQVWRVLPAAYDSLGLAVAAMDPVSHIVDNGGVKLQRQLGGVPLSRYIDCASVRAGSSVDNYDVVLNVRTQIRSNDSAATSVITEVQAMGRPAAFSQDYSRCSSTGKLEARLADVVRAKLEK
jgi:hypothetical protein